MGRSMEKAHITAIHMSPTPSPNLRASAMLSAQEKGEHRLTLQCSCKGSRHNAGGVKLLLCRVQGRCVAKTDYLENCKIYHLSGKLPTSCLTLAYLSGKFCKFK